MVKGWVRYFILCLFFCFPFFAKAQLSGTYTIDTSKAASSTNYKSFSAAVSDMVSGTRSDGGTANGAGVKGGVVFNVADAVYSEQVTVDSIPGTSATNTVTFQSASGDSSKVILTYPSSTYSWLKDYTLGLNKVSHFILRGITVLRDGSYAYGTTIALTGNSSYITIEHCKIISIDPGTTSSSACAIYVLSTRDSFNTYSNNLIKRGLEGICLTRVSTYRGTLDNHYCLITQNLIDSSKYGIGATYSDGITITNNAITNSFGALDLSYCNGAVQVTGNIIHGVVSLSSCAGSISKRALVANNVIMSPSFGINLTSTSYYDILYNNIYSNPSSSSYAATAISTDFNRGAGIRIYDNVLATSGQGPLLNLEAGTLSDYNVLYNAKSGGSDQAAWNNNYYYSLDAYQYGSMQDLHSIIADPKFINTTTDLRTSLNSLINSATPFSTVTTDIVGRQRSKTFPDIGAYEYSIKTDAKLSYITKLPTTVCDTTLDIKVRLHNTGNTHLDSVKLSLKRNGVVMLSKTFKVSLDNDQDSLIFLQTLPLRNREDTLLVQISNVNTLSRDSIPNNDSISTVIRRALYGNYIIGSGGSDFRYVNTVSNLLTRYGICGPVVFNIKNGTYTGAVRLAGIRGADANNRITFQSLTGDSSGVIIQEDAAFYANAVSLDSGNYITFNKVTISLNYVFGAANNNSTLSLYKSSYNIFSNCQLLGDLKTTSSTDEVISIIYKSNYNTIKNCVIKTAGAGMYITDWDKSYSKGNAVINNDISYFSEHGIVANSQDSLTISGNIFHDGNRTYSNYPASIECADGKSTYITNNKIYVRGGGYQIELQDMAAPANQRGLIANNMISGYSSTATMYIDGMQNFDVVYNSLQNTAGADALYFNDTLKPGNNRVMENIFYSSGGGATVEYTAAAVTNNFALRFNYNDLYTKSSATVFAKYNGTNYNTFTAYKTASKLDSSSTQLDPKFYSSVDLHTKLASLAGKATPFPGLTTDIDGEPRSSTKPYVGADESMPHLDAGLKSITATAASTCDPYVDVKLRLLDSGGRHIDSVKISVKDDTAAVSSKYYKLNLNYMQDTLLDIGNVNIHLGSSTLKVILAGVNGVKSDSVASNDTIAINVISKAPAPKPGRNREFCSGQTDTLGIPAISGHTYSWSSKPSGFSSTSANPTVTPTATTTYYLTETITTTGCSSTDSVTLTLNTPKAYTGVNDTICKGTFVSLGTTPVAGHTYKWTTKPAGLTYTSSSITVAPSVTTKYYLTETNSGGCSRNDSVTVVVNPTPTPKAGTTSSICSGSAVSLGSTAISGHTYSWTSNPAGFYSTLANPTVYPTVKTVYRLTETITATGCSSSDSVTISVNPLPTPYAGANDTICAGYSAYLGRYSASGHTYRWTSKPVGFTSTSPTTFVYPTVSTTYYLTETITSTGCSKTDSVRITINPVSAGIGQKNQSICQGQSLTIGSSAISGHTYSWTSSPPGLSSTASQVTVKPAASTTYYRTEKITSSGCTRKDTVVVIVGSVPNPKLRDTTICEGTTISIGVTPTTGHTYSWTTNVTGGVSSTSSTITPAPPAGTWQYAIKETNTASGCIGQDTMTVTVKAYPQIDAGNDTTVCAGTYVIVGKGSSTFGATYAWTSKPAGFTYNYYSARVAPTVTTTYYLTASNGNCTVKDSVKIIVDSISSAGIGKYKQSVCNGHTLIIGTKGVTGHTYKWTSKPPGYTSTYDVTTVSPTVNTTYYRTETVGTTGCSKTDSIYVTVNPVPNPTIKQRANSICQGDTISLNVASVSGHSYQWFSFDPSKSGSTLVGSGSRVLLKPAGTLWYFIKETDTSTGCEGLDTAIIAVYPKPIINAGSDTTTCLGTTVVLGRKNASVYTYSWSSSPSGFTSSTASPVVMPSVSTTYYLKASTTTGCTAYDTVVINVVQPPIPAAGKDVTLCASGSTTIGLPAVSGVSYSWTSSPAGFTSTAANPTVKPAVTTAYYLTETNSTGCSTVDTVIVTINPVPVPKPGASTSICDGDTVNLGAPAISGHSYAWRSQPAGLSSASASVTIKPAVTTTYYLTESIDATGCSKTDSVTITVHPKPVANAGNDQSICKGASTVIGTKAMSGRSYNWHSSPSGFGSIAANPTVKPLVTTTYYLVVTNDTTGCTEADTVTITVNPLPLAISGSSQAICKGDTVRLGTTAVNGNIYSWSSSPAGFSSSVSNPLVKPVQTTTYYLAETTPSGCSKTDSITITVNPVPVADAGSDRSICFGQSTTLGIMAISGRTYSWISMPSGFSSSKAQVTVSPKKTTAYFLTVSNDTTGCTATDSVTVTVNPAPSIASYGDNITTCVHASYTLSIPSTAGYNYSWTSRKLGITINTFGKSSSSFRWDTAGVDTVWVTATNSSGCKDSARFVVTIDNLPDADWTVSTSGISYRFKATDSLQNHYAWKFGDGNIDSGYSVSHTYAKNNTYRVMLTVENSSGCTTSYDSLINVTVSGVAEQAGLTNGLKIYPNPFSRLTNISYHLDKASQVTIEILDLEGRKITELVNGLQPAGNQACQFNAGKFNCVPGVYLVKMVIADQVSIQRIIRVD